MYTTPDSMAKAIERRCELPANRPPTTLALLEEVASMQRDIGHLAAELRYHQVSSEPVELDEWIFSLIFLDARMSRLALHLVLRDGTQPDNRYQA